MTDKACSATSLPIVPSAIASQPEPVAWTTQLALDCAEKTALGFEVSGVNLWGEKGVPLYAKSVPSSMEPSEGYPGIAHDLETARSILRMLVDAASADKLEDFTRTSNIADAAADFLKNAAPQAPATPRDGGSDGLIPASSGPAVAAPAIAATVHLKVSDGCLWLHWSHGMLNLTHLVGTENINARRDMVHAMREALESGVGKSSSIEPTPEMCFLAWRAFDPEARILLDSPEGGEFKKKMNAAIKAALEVWQRSATKP